MKEQHCIEATSKKWPVVTMLELKDVLSMLATWSFEKSL